MNLASIDLNLLVALDALLRERNVTRAAQRIGLSQPGMSNALARLRKLFDDPLLIKEGRELMLTRQAEELIDPVQEILTLVQRTLDKRPGFEPASDRRTFSISCSDYATLVLVGPLLRCLAQEATGVTIHVFPRSSDVPQLLHRDEVDFVIEPEELMIGTNFPSQTLLPDRWLSVISASNNRVGERMTMQNFLELPHLVYSIGPGLARSVADQHLVDLGIERRVEFTVESFLLAPFLLHDTSLTTLVLERAAPLLRAAADIRLLEPPLDLPPITEALWWHPRHSPDPAHRWLRTRFTAVAAELDNKRRNRQCSIG